MQWASSMKTLFLEQIFLRRNEFPIKAGVYCHILYKRLQMNPGRMWRFLVEDQSVELALHIVYLLECICYVFIKHLSTLYVLSISPFSEYGMIILYNIMYFLSNSRRVSKTLQLKPCLLTCCWLAFGCFGACLEYIISPLPFATH